MLCNVYLFLKRFGVAFITVYLKEDLFQSNWTVSVQLLWKAVHDTLKNFKVSWTAFYIKR